MYYEACLRGNLFMAYTVIAGVALPVAAATLNSKFTLHNPAGSGKNIELITFTMGIDSATTVVNGIGLMIQRTTTGSGGAPTLTTACNNFALGIGGIPMPPAGAWASLKESDIKARLVPFIRAWSI